MTTAAELRVQLGDGPAWLVRATDPPSLDIWVGPELLRLAGPAFVNPRIDLVCIKAELGMVFAQALAGIPCASPIAPATPAGWLPVATVGIPPFAMAVYPSNIQEIRP